MRIGIDISQMAYENTGVANYLDNLVENLLKTDKENEYILFFSSMRRSISTTKFTENHPNVKIKAYPFPPILLDFLWNKLHIFPIEWFVGTIDIFISSDWTQPPAKHAKLITILYDLIVYKFPQEMDRKIVETQKRKLQWVKKECKSILCISEATKMDAQEILGVEKEKLVVICPGLITV